MLRWGDKMDEYERFSDKIEEYHRNASGIEQEITDNEDDSRTIRHSKTDAKSDIKGLKVLVKQINKSKKLTKAEKRDFSKEVKILIKDFKRIIAVY
jgi:septal ring factor EnvC (AmiA/AmiB activator)